ncbi:hypothetical protein [Paenibacillus sp. FSL L8-0708]|uniref:hypothetical protein n=1 Tax=Paenibacillus sp. FSL L8-0708 TaxID=2975311 RepID=UPI0030F6BD6B
MILGKKLPVVQPIVDGYSHYGSVFSIIATNGTSYIPWFLSRFSQLYCQPAKNFFINMDEPNWFPDKTNFCPFLDVNLVDKGLINKMGSTIIDSIIELINNNYYLFMVVEQKHIPGSYGFNKYSFPHDIMIYGYNLNREILYIADNFSGKYQFSECSFTQFDLAYHTLDKARDRLDSKICLLKNRSDRFEEFDLMRVVDSIYGYWKSSSPEQRSSNWSSAFDGCVKGIESYEVVKEYLNLLSKGEVKYDIRPFHSLWEHKKIMIMRLEYMQRNGLLKTDHTILNSYKNIEQMSLILRNLILKYNLTQDHSILTRMSSEVDKIVFDEHKIIPAILNNIQNPEYKKDNKVFGLQMDHKLRWSLS